MNLKSYNFVHRKCHNGCFLLVLKCATRKKVFYVKCFVIPRGMDQMFGTKWKKTPTLLDGPEFWILANTHTCEVYPLSIGHFEVRMPIFAVPLHIFKAHVKQYPQRDARGHQSHWVKTSTIFIQAMIESYREQKRESASVVLPCCYRVTVSRWNTNRQVQFKHLSDRLAYCFEGLFNYVKLPWHPCFYPLSEAQCYILHAVKYGPIH